MRGVEAARRMRGTGADKAPGSPWRALALATALASTLGLGACATLLAPVLERPTVNLERAEVTSLNLSQAEMLFGFRVGNPNNVSLPLAGIEYEVLVNGARLLSGAQDRRVDVAAHGESQVELPVTVRYEDLVAAFRTLRGRERSGYEIRAGFLFDVPVLGRIRVPVEEQGDLALPSLLGR